MDTHSITHVIMLIQLNLMMPYFRAGVQVNFFTTLPITSDEYDRIHAIFGILSKSIACGGSLGKSVAR